MKILGIGNAIVDVICKVDDSFISQHGLTKSTMKLIFDETEFKKLLTNLKIEKTVSGGSVANSIVGISQLGNKVGFIGKVSDDEFGSKYEEGLKKENVEYFYSRKKEELPTGTCLILITPDSERTMCTFLGTAGKINENDVNTDAIKQSELIFLEGYLWDEGDPKKAFDKAISNALIEINAVIFIILGSVPFIAYIKYLNGDKKVFYKDAQINFFIKTIVVSVIIIFIFLLFKNSNSGIFLLRQVIFNVVSILTGTGYVTTNYSDWGGFPLIFFLVLMFIGGCAGSTACGLKIFRIHILYKFFVIQLKKYIYPRGIFVLKYGDNILNEKFISSIISFVFLYIIIFFMITTLLSISGLDFITAVSGAATSISNVGPGLGGMIGPNGNFSLLPDFSKWVLSAGMILGRLELFAIIVLFIPSFWRRY